MSSHLKDIKKNAFNKEKEGFPKNGNPSKGRRLSSIYYAMFKVSVNEQGHITNNSRLLIIVADYLLKVKLYLKRKGLPLGSP
jgi:hypothetical protein